MPDSAPVRESKRKYDASEAGRARKARYKASAKGRATDARYDATEAGRVRARRYSRSRRRLDLKSIWDANRRIEQLEQTAPHQEGAL